MTEAIVSVSRTIAVPAPWKTLTPFKVMKRIFFGANVETTRRVGHATGFICVEVLDRETTITGAAGSHYRARVDPLIVEHLQRRQHRNRSPYPGSPFRRQKFAPGYSHVRSIP